LGIVRWLQLPWLARPLWSSTCGRANVVGLTYVHCLLAVDNVVASQVSVSGCCLARDSDDLWYRATVVDVLDDDRYHVMFDLSQREAKLNANEIFPLHGTVSRHSFAFYSYSEFLLLLFEII